MSSLTANAVKHGSLLLLVAALAAAASACSDGSGASTSGDGGTGSTSSALCDPEGSWDVDFQWSGRTPGELTMVVAADKTAKILAGDGVGATTGTWSVTGETITWSFADGSTFAGAPTASCAIGAGSMKNTAGKLGKFTASKGGSASSSSSSGGACTGCTADSDCGSCERCERTTCSCIARLTCR